jgi:hypothetical protein
MTGGATKEEKDFLDYAYPNREKWGNKVSDYGSVRGLDYLVNMYLDLNDLGYQDWTEEIANLSYESYLIEQTYTIPSVLGFDHSVEMWRDLTTGRFTSDPEKQLF